MSDVAAFSEGSPYVAIRDTSPTLQDPTRACRLAREMLNYYNLGPNELAVVSDLLLNETATVESLSRAIETHGDAVHSRATETAVSTIRHKADGLLVTQREWRVATYSLAPAVVVMYEDTLTERQKLVIKARSKVEDWASDYLHDRIRLSWHKKDPNPYHQALDRLMQNLGWSIPSEALNHGRKDASMFIQSLSAILPAGLIEIVRRSHNNIGYRIDLNVLLGLKKPGSEEPVAQIKATKITMTEPVPLQKKIKTADARTPIKPKPVIIAALIPEPTEYQNGCAKTPLLPIGYEVACSDPDFVAEMRAEIMQDGAVDEHTLVCIAKSHGLDVASAKQRLHSLTSYGGAKVFKFGQDGSVGLSGFASSPRRDLTFLAKTD